ncbi:MAG TPA: SDR family oxidoreductase [Steroidobacteraceae bacterium]|nr:SDR family oxidoreductase [Steroidobacteraceae bacterium]
MTTSGSKRLSGKTAVVTGSGRGIGETIARLFATQGAAVVVTSRTAADIARVVQAVGKEGGTAHGVVADMAEASGVTALVDFAVGQFGRIDILVHNAGIFPYDPIETMPDESWCRVIDVNLTAAFRLLKASVPHMKKGGGRILFTSSIQGNRAAVPGCAHYAASKGGLNGLIRAAALELARYAITVNGVEPGLMLTDEVARAIKSERRERMADAVPLKRWGIPVEVAQAMLFLASEEAAYVTGQTLVVDGGATLPVFGG